MVVVDRSSQLALKKRRCTSFDPMEAEAAKAKIASVKEKFEREIRVFEMSELSSSTNDPSNSEESDDFYEFTAEDYHCLMATKKEDKFLKTRKIREAEEAARRARITKVVIRVRFPDNHTLEATFHPSETIQSLVDLLRQVVARPEPFHIYTTPPKRLLKDMSQDFYSAGFIPGAIVYFSYDVPKGDNKAHNTGPFLKEEILLLKGLELAAEQERQQETEESAAEPAEAAPSPAAQERRPAEKKFFKPKWLKM